MAIQPMASMTTTRGGLLKTAEVFSGNSSGC
jgi:hypothetical protein